MVYWIFSFMLTAIDTWCMLYLLDTFLKKKDAGRFEKVRFVLFYSANIFVAVLFHLLDIVINWWKFVAIFIALFVLGLFYFKATAKLSEILIVLYVRRIWKSPNNFQTLKEWYMLISIPLFSIAGVVGMFQLFNGDEKTRNVCLFLTIGLVAINFITIYFLQDILDKGEQLRVSTLVNQNVKNQIEACHDMDALYECQRRKWNN